jgi:hypothetical protein
MQWLEACNCQSQVDNTCSPQFSQDIVLLSINTSWHLNKIYVKLLEIDLDVEKLMYVQGKMVWSSYITYLDETDVYMEGVGKIKNFQVILDQMNLNAY